jgi:hypothetical protein
VAGDDTDVGGALVSMECVVAGDCYTLGVPRPFTFLYTMIPL